MVHPLGAMSGCVLSTLWVGGGAAAADPGALLDTRVSDASVILKLATTDAASTNDCVTRAEQQAIINARTPAADGADHKIRAHLDVHCQGRPPKKTIVLKQALSEPSDFWY